MNRRAQQAFLRDVRLAARLGTPEALDAALQGLLAEDTVAANRALPPRVLTRLIVPAGQALAVDTVPEAYRQRLARSPYAALRALAAAAWGTRFAHGQAPMRALEAVARDPRPEVRTALRLALTHAPPSRRAALVHQWLTPRTPPRSPRAVALAWEMAPDVLPPDELWRYATVWATHGEGPEWQPAMVRALHVAAARDPDLAMQRLRAAWTRERWPARLVAQVLAGPWAAHRAQDVLALLHDLYTRYGHRRWITQALKALERHAALDDAAAVLHAWQHEGAA